MDKINFRKLNESLRYALNELSDDTKQSYLSKRQAQLNKAQTNVDKAKAMIKKSDRRTINNLPNETTKDNAKEALKALRARLSKVGGGEDYRIYSEEDALLLEVRYWGEWENPEDAEDEEDYDWQVLTDESKEKLDEILTAIQKQYKVKIEQVGSEKNWLVFSINVGKDLFDEFVKYVQAENFPLTLYSDEIKDKNNYYIDFWYDDESRKYEFYISMKTSDDISCAISFDDDLVDKVDVEFNYLEELIAYGTFKIPNDLDILEMEEWFPICLKRLRSVHAQLAETLDEKGEDEFLDGGHLLEFEL